MEVEIRDLQYDDLPRELILRVAAEAVRVAQIDLATLSLVLVDDDQIQDINRRFRNKDRPTDVISFEAEDEGDGPTGEIIISIETTKRQGISAGHGFDAELAWLIAHGVLHVAGMDDTTQAQLDVMIEKQRIVMHRLGLDTTV